MAEYSSVGNQGPSAPAVGFDLRFETIHRRLPAISDPDHTHQIEVRNKAGSNVSYRLSILAMPEGTCAQAAYVCEAWRALPRESGCTDEPDPTCTLQRRSIPLPQVWNGSTNVQGWVVHADPTEVKHPHAPTVSELAAIETKCQQACEDHWQDSPAVSITCNASTSFREPYLRPGDSIAARAVIPDGLHDGSGDINMVAITSCRSVVDLIAASSDPDADLDSVRWYVDDQLFHPSYDSFVITQGHQIRAVATDARGAATSDTHTIDCI